MTNENNVNPDQMLVEQLANELGIVIAQRIQMSILLELANKEIALLREGIKDLQVGETDESVDN